MQASLLAITSSLPRTNGDLRPGLEPDDVTPGFLGFISTLLIVVAVVLLMRSMAGRVRRVRYRALVAEREGIAVDMEVQSAPDLTGDAAAGQPSTPAVSKRRHPQKSIPGS